MSWYNSSWTYRQKYTIDAAYVDGVVNMVPIYTSKLNRHFHLNALSGAADIRITQSDGTTELARYIVNHDAATYTGCIMVEISAVISASVNTDIYIYYGNAGASDYSASATYGRNATFAGYAGAYMPGITLTDLTGAGRDLTAVNSPGTAASGLEGITAADYNGSSSYHGYDGTQAITSWPATLESYGLVDVRNAGAQAFFGIAQTADNQNTLFVGASGTATMAPYSGWRGASATGAFPESGTIAEDVAMYVAGVRSGVSSGVTYKNGSAGTADTTTIAALGSANRLTIGALRRSPATVYLDGWVAVALLSSSVRSADYVSTMADNWAGTMYSTGAWTALDSCTDGSTGWVLFQTAATTSASGSLVDWTSTSNALVDDSNYTQAALDGGGNTDSETLKLTNPAYGTTIPTGAASYTVQFRIKRVRGSGGGNKVNDLNVQFIDDTGALVGDNLAATTTDWPSLSATTADYIATGLTLDGTEFTSAAGLAISATANNAAGAVNARVLVAWIKIDWTCGDDAAAKSRGFFALTN